MVRMYEWLSKELIELTISVVKVPACRYIYLLLLGVNLQLVAVTAEIYAWPLTRIGLHPIGLCTCT